jgi:hypothetical protein
MVMKFSLKTKRLCPGESREDKGSSGATASTQTCGKGAIGASDSSAGGEPPPKEIPLSASPRLAA